EACGFISLSQAPSLVHFDHIRRAVDLALRQAGVDRTDIDFVEFYDPATIVPLILLESAGFCGAGEGGAFVESGGVELGGRLPMNTHGGTLSFRHPGMGAALDSVVEAVTQLRGEGGARQVEGAR